MLNQAGNYTNLLELITFLFDLQNTFHDISDFYNVTAEFSEVKFIVFTVAHLANAVMEIEENLLSTTICKSGCDSFSYCPLPLHKITRLDLMSHVRPCYEPRTHFWDTRYNSIF